MQTDHEPISPVSRSFSPLHRQYPSTNVAGMSDQLLGHEEDLGLVAWLKRHGFAAWYDWLAWPMLAQRQSVWLLSGTLCLISFCGFVLGVAVWSNPEGRIEAAQDALRANQTRIAGLRAEAKDISDQINRLAPSQTTPDTRMILMTVLQGVGVVEGTARVTSEVDIGDWHGRDWGIKGRATYGQWQSVQEELRRLVPWGEPRSWRAEPFASDERWVRAEFTLRSWSWSDPTPAPSGSTSLGSRRPRPKP